MIRTSSMYCIRCGRNNNKSNMGYDICGRCREELTAAYGVGETEEDLERILGWGDWPAIGSNFSNILLRAKEEFAKKRKWWET